MTLTKSAPPKNVSKKDIPINVEYQDKAKTILREAIGGDYKTLAERLNAMGIEITARGVENKIARGSFPASFFFQCLDAMGAMATFKKLPS